MLERAREELVAPDLPFTYATLSKTHIESYLKPIGAAEFQKPIADCLAAGMGKRSVGDGVSATGLPAIATRLAAGGYDLSHVRYVLDQVKGQVKAGKVKK
jgi:hypothetical protein